MHLKQIVVFSVLHSILLIVTSTNGSDSLKTQEGCNVTELWPLNNVHCEYIQRQDNQTEDSTSSYVPLGTKCVFVEHKSSSEVIKQCGVHGWHNTDIENAVQITRDVVFYSHGGRVKRFFGLLIGAVAAVIGFVCIFACHHARRDHNRPNMICDTVPTKLADPIQTHTHVDWKEPVAHDNEDGEIVPRRRGPAPGLLFNEGKHCVHYVATDRAGNNIECCVTILVIVKRCPKIKAISDGYYRCHPSSDMVQGTSCYFGCYRGHKLVGDSTLTCIGHNDDNPGKWSKRQPKCERLQCSRLPLALKPLHMKCTDTNFYRSICTFSCDKGYDIIEGQTRVMLCTENGTWRGSIPKCRDSQPPVIKSCNGYQVGFTDRSSVTGKMSLFELPAVEDNVDVNLQPQLISKANPLLRLRAGVYDISYSATDLAGNKAQICKIKLVMKMITCPRIYPTADSYVSCDTGTRYGSNCEFSCDSGAVLNGTRHVTCDRMNNKAFGYWNWGQQQPYCQDAKRCRQELKTPYNGAMACDYWLGGKFCHMFCRNKYDIPRSSSLLGNGNSMFVCGENSGKWTPSTSVPDCIRVVGGSLTRYRLDIEFHFSGNCHDSDVVEDIKETFISTWKSSGYKEGCLHEVEKCNPSNIQVRCGMGHRKRSANLRLIFNVQMEGTSGIDSDTFTNMSLGQFSAIQRLRKSLKEGALNFEFDNNTLIAADITYTNLELQCMPGMVLTNNRKSCAKCGPGTFYERTQRTCEPCPRGTFQPNEGQYTCLKCPKRKTTKYIRSSAREKCEDACPPGSWSSDGTPPCTFCPKGTFLQDYGGNECSKCTGSRTTDFDGSGNNGDCEEFDLVFRSNGSFVDREVDLSGLSNLALTFWIMIDKDLDKANILSFNVSNKYQFEIFIKENVVILGSENGQTNSVNKLELSRWYPIVLRISKNTINMFWNEQNFFNSQAVKFGTASGNIRIGGSFIGRISQLNIFSDYGAVDEHYVLKRCFMNNTGDILSWKSFEDTLVSDVFVHTPSDCDDTNECDDDPCLNGNCTDELNGYSCLCFYGFYGDQCEHNIDDCSDNACDNNGTCIDGAASYTCACDYEFTGDLCEVKMVDGEWSEWSNWTSCSMTCGNGTMTRRRLCNDPTPDNGGLYCVGNDTEHKICMDEECTFCPQLEQPENTILTCDNDTVTDTINCTLRCELGYGFDHDTKDFYYCGPKTLHQWDIQSDENPLARLPSCTELTNATFLEIHYSANYANLVCDVSASAETVEDKIRDIVKQASIKTSCISENTCHISRIDVVNCSGIHREKRDISLNEAGFRTNLECDTTKRGSEECQADLLNAFENLVQQTVSSELDSEIEKIVYPIDRQSLKVDTTVTCATGMVPIDYRCVPCSKGRYADKGECKLCGIGSYQNIPGRVYCTTCPEGRSTLGKGSVSINDCTVKKDILKAAVNGMLLGIGCALAVVLLVLTVLFIRREHMKKKRKVVDFSFGGAKTHDFTHKAVFNKQELNVFKSKIQNE